LAERERPQPAKLTPDGDPVPGRIRRQAYDQQRPPCAPSIAACHDRDGSSRYAEPVISR
jgi:hypothetical protein